MAISASAAYAATRTLPLAQAPPQIIPVNTPSSFMTTAVSAAAAAASSSKATQHSAESHTPTALGRWSLLNHKLPAADAVQSIHVYDFDNTLFKTPLPNSKLWNASTMGYLSSQEMFVTGGWWHDVRILAATGAGQDKEEPRAWEGWWNEQIVELVRLSEKQPGALCVLLTGRSERGFGDLVQRMVNSKKMAFDMITLKPAAGPSNERFASTMAFKQAFLETLMETYPAADEIRIYEDRPRHVEGFREFLAQYNERRQQRPAAPLPPIAGEVVPVAEMATTLDPVIEVAEVQHMVNCHNAAGGGRRGRLALTKTVFFTGYLVKEADTKRLLGLLQVPPHVTRRDLKYHGNSIMISPRSCPPHLLAKAGGMGSKMTWRVEAVGTLDNNLWAVKVRPASPSASYHTAEAIPLVVLAVYRSARPHEAARIRKWQPVAADQAFEFETTVGEKAVLRVEAEHAAENQEESEGQQSPGGRPPPRKRTRVGPGLHNNGPGHFNANNAHRPRPNPAGAIPTQPAAFVPPRGPGGAGQFGPQGGRGYHFQSAGRGGRGGMGGGGGFRGQGFAGNRGGYRGGAAMRGGRGGAGGAAGGPASKAPGRPQPHHYYQSLDDAGPSQSSHSDAPPRQQIVYDDEAM